MTSPTIYFDLGDTLIFGPQNDRQPFPDAVATLATLYDRGYLLGLLSDQASGTTVADVQLRLDGFGFGPYIDPITISSELPGNVFKPDPAIFQLALQKAGFTTASDETIFITENPIHIAAARALGWRAVLKRNGSTCVATDGECVEDLDGLLDLLPDLPTDLWIRDAADHTGAHDYEGRFWDSPDLWIRNGPDGGTSHQAPEFGQDNWFHARVRNRGTGIARQVQVAFNVHPWAGTQFVYPADYFPPIAVASVGDVAPGEVVETSALWPSAQVPPADTHACWIAAVYGVGEAPSSGSHVWEHNNLAQKNLTVVDLEPGDSATVPFRFSNHGITAEVAHLEIRRPIRWPELGVVLTSAGGRPIPELWHGATLRPPSPAPTDPPVAEIEFLTPASLSVRTGANTRRVRLELAARSAILRDRTDGSDADAADDAPTVHRQATLRRGPTGAELAIRSGPAAIVSLAARPLRNELVGVQVSAPPTARPGETLVVDVVERDHAGRVVGGIAVQIVIR